MTHTTFTTFTDVKRFFVDAELGDELTDDEMQDVFRASGIEWGAMFSSDDDDDRAVLENLYSAAMEVAISR